MFQKRLANLQHAFSLLSGVQYILYAYSVSMIYLVVSRVVSSYSPVTIEHLSLHNMALKCKDTEFLALFPMQCASVIRHPPSSFPYLLLRTALAKVYLCGEVPCDELLTPKFYIATLLALFILQAPKVAKRTYTEVKRYAQRRRLR